MKKKILAYARNRRGISLVLMAVMLAVLIVFAALAIDIAMMYFEKNQLQVAADAAALAGAAVIDCDDGGTTCNQPVFDTNTTNYRRLAARKEAWRIACKNSSTNRPVFLVTDDNRNPASPNCDTPPTSGLNESTNAVTGDIVVGNWSRTARPCSSTGETSNFCPANGSTGLIINAVQARPSRAGVTSGMPAIRLFVGKIFNFFNSDWSLMHARARAIAAMPPRASSFVAVGNLFCPAAGDPICRSGTGSIYPNVCELVTPRELFAEPDPVPPERKVGWTSLLFRPGSTREFEDLMCGVAPYQDICNSPGIYGIPGTSTATFRDYRSLMCDPVFDSGSKDIDPGTRRVTGWEVIMPIVDRSDPMSPPDPNPVWGYAKVHILEICVPGAPGCKGAGSCTSYGYCRRGDKKIVVDRISCIRCGIDALGVKPTLVK